MGGKGSPGVEAVQTDLLEKCYKTDRRPEGFYKSLG